LIEALRNLTEKDMTNATLKIARNFVMLRASLRRLARAAVPRRNHDGDKARV